MPQYICQFTTPGNQTYFWGPFPTKTDAQKYLDKSREQYQTNHGVTDPCLRLVRELHDPQNPTPQGVIIDLELNGQ